MRPSFMKLACTLAVFMIVSCSVKEDRSGCPCYLILDVDAFVDGGFFHGGAVAFSARDLDFVEPVELDSYYRTGYVKTVSRIPLRVACAAGIRACDLSGTTVLVRPGGPADSLMAFACDALPEGDELYVKAEPHKQYCAVHMIVEHPEEYDGFSVTVGGRYSGLDILSLKPVPGENTVVAGHCPDGSFVALLLRQADDAGLAVTMLDAEGEQLYSIDLSAALKEASYDWTKPDLDDVTLRVDYAKSHVTMEISEWNSDENYRNVEI